jgi:hypothetical protein
MDSVNQDGLAQATLVLAMHRRSAEFTQYAANATLATRTQVVIDGRSLPEPAVMVALGLEYNCIRRLRLFRSTRSFAGWR